MPANSDERCVGIALVMEALLDGELVNRHNDENEVDDLAKLATKIYASIATGEPVRYGSYVTIDGVRSPISSRAALDRISTQVADLYKRDFHRALETDGDRERLLDAATNFIQTAGEVDQILEADPDETAAFAGSGKRFFPDGTVKDTDHAFLLAKKDTGEIILYDPNDPGQAIRCSLQDTDDGLIVEWECRYRDTGHITTQGYQIVHLPEYFRELQK